MLFPSLVQLFPRFRYFLMLCLATACAVLTANAQELLTQPTPFTALLDFAVLRHPAAPKQALPIWLESVQVNASKPASSSALLETTTVGLPEPQPPAHTVFRIRLRPMPGFNDNLLLRLFFDDRADAHPTVTAWSETGERRFVSSPLGAGLELPASESLSIPTEGVDYLEIDVPGDGWNVRKLLLTTLKKTTVSTAFDFSSPAITKTTDPVIDPFGNANPQPVSENDSYLFGRVRATLEAGVIKLAPATLAPTVTGTAMESGTAAPQSSVVFEFNLESVPLLATIALDILNADPLAPLQATVNETTLPPLAIAFPDLADPGYVGLVRPLQTMRFRYSGWLHGQVIIPGSALKTGVNTLTLQLPPEAGPSAIRAIELQLKHNWRILDYNLAP